MSHLRAKLGEVLIEVFRQKTTDQQTMPSTDGLFIFFYQA